MTLTQPRVAPKGPTSQGAELCATAQCLSQQSKAQLGVSPGPAASPAVFFFRDPNLSTWFCRLPSCASPALLCQGACLCFQPTLNPLGLMVKSKSMLSWCLLSDSLDLSFRICTLRENSTSAGPQLQQVRGRLHPAQSEEWGYWTPG